MLREPLSVSGGSRYIPSQVGSHISISSTMAITSANTSLGHSDMCRRLSLITGNLRTRHGSALVGVIHSLPVGTLSGDLRHIASNGAAVRLRLPTPLVGHTSLRDALRCTRSMHDS